MTETALASTPKTTNEKKLIPIDPIFLNTPTGTVAVFGHEQISRKLLEVLGIALAHDAFEITYHGVKSIVFRIDGYPKKNGKMHCSNFAPDTESVAINMAKTLEKAMERSMDHPSTSLLASWWIEMLLNVGHELHHAVRYNTKRDELTDNKELLAKEEELAEDYSNELITALVQEYDVEPPAFTDETWFSAQITELFSGKEKDDEWVMSQKNMLDNGEMWKHVPDEGEPITLHSFKDLICLITKGDETTSEWNKTTISIPSGVKTLDEQLNGKKTIIDQNTTKQEESRPEEQVFHQDDIMEDIIDEPVQQQTHAFSFTNRAMEQRPPAQQFGTQKPVTIVGTDQYDAITISRIAKQVYMKMYNFIFTNCKPLTNSDLGFSNPEAVCTTPIRLTDEEKTIFVTMNHLDINGRWCTDVSTTDGLLGKVMKNTKLPAYELFLNINGTIHKRLFMPQNTAKRKNGQLTQRALEARAGNAIAYVIIPSDGQVTQYGPSIVNGEYKVPYTS